MRGSLAKTLRGLAREEFPDDEGAVYEHRRTSHHSLGRTRYHSLASQRGYYKLLKKFCKG